MDQHRESKRMGIRCAADIIRNSKRALVLSGAGISTPSGIPDFRSPNSGLWSRFDPFEVASLASFRYHPEKFFAWFHNLATGIANAVPNPAHLGLARLEQSGLISTIITQNIDMLHQRAGSTNVLEVHGSLSSLTCIRCFHQVSASGYVEPYIVSGVIPHCPHCDGILKPDLILFGEQLPAKTWMKAENAAKTCDCMIVAGSSLEVLPVAGLPMRALENGAHLIVINNSPTYIDLRADVVFREDLAEIIPLIVQEVLYG